MFNIKSIPEIKLGVLSYFTSINFEFGVKEFQLTELEQKNLACISFIECLLNYYMENIGSATQQTEWNCNQEILLHFTKMWFFKIPPKQKGQWNTIEGGIGGFHSLPDVTRTMGSIVFSLHGQWLPYFNWASSLIEYRDCSSSGLMVVKPCMHIPLSFVLEIKMRRNMGFGYLNYLVMSICLSILVYIF